jgi:flagella basal body P-ring formation protein FlgA
MYRRAFVLTILFAFGAAFAPATAAVPRTQIVTGARIAAIADPIARALVSDPNRAVARAYTLFDQTVPSGDVAIVPMGAPNVNATYVSIALAIDVDGKVARTLVAAYRVTSYITTAVAARDLAPGTVLAEGDLQLARVAGNGRPAVDPSVLLGRKLVGATSRGALVYTEQTSAVELVKAGQPVVLIIRDGPVVLSADVVARTSGALGDSVAVYNASTQRSLSGVVTGPNTVVLVLPGS